MPPDRPLVLDLADHLPRGWPDRALKAALAHGRRFTRQGPSPGSVEPETAGLDYIILTTPAVKEHLPFLWKLYRSASFRRLIEEWAGRRLGAPSLDLWTVNVNLLAGQGARYELHHDRTPFTAILFGTTHASGDGDLIVHYGGAAHCFQSQTNRCVVIDGARWAHGVSPLRGETYRLTALFCIPPADGPLPPNSWDDFLYHS